MDPTTANPFTTTQSPPVSTFDTIPGAGIAQQQTEAPPVQPMVLVAPKKWYESKIFWANIIVGLGIPILQYLAGIEVNPAFVAGALAILNIILRFLTTQPVY